MAHHPPIGIYYLDEDTPCWAFKTRNAFKKAFHLKELLMVNGLNSDDGYKLCDNFHARHMERVDFLENMGPRIVDGHTEAITRILDNCSPRDLLLPLTMDPSTSTMRSCNKCHLEKPLTLGHFHWTKAKRRFQATCIECLNNLINAKNAKASAEKRAANSFTCATCNELMERKEMAKGETDTCKSCKRDQVKASFPAVKKWIGLFRKDEQAAEPIWKWDSAHSFYSAQGLHQQKFDRMMSETGFWSQDDESPYVVRYITKDTFDSIHIDAEKYEQVLTAIQTGDTTLSGTIRTGCSTQRCIWCNVVKEQTTGNYTKEKGHWRSTCNLCRTTANAERASLEYEEDLKKGWFQCTECDEKHNASERMQGQRACRASMNAKKTTAVAERAKTIDRDEVEGRPCKCGKLFDRERFKWKQTHWGTCNECFNKKKYWKAYRERWRSVDPNGYLSYFCEQQLRYRLLHPEVCSAYNTHRRTDVDARFAAIKRYAALRNISFKDESTLRTLVGKACHYCDALPDPGDRLNGIDRLDSGQGFSGDNSVPACHLDNILKGSLKPEDYIWRMCQIYVVSQKNGETLDMDAVIFSGFTNSENTTIAGSKAGREQFEENAVGICYLCEETGMLGLDRVNSSKSYLDEDNVRACCWPCNRIKLDLSLKALYLQAWRIYSVFHSSLDMAVVPTVYPEPELERPTTPIPKVMQRRQHAQHYGYLVHNKGSGSVIARYNGIKELADALGCSVYKLRRNFDQDLPYIPDQRWHISRVPAKSYNLMLLENECTTEEAFEEYLQECTKEVTSTRSTRRPNKRKFDQQLLVLTEDGSVPLAKYGNEQELANAVKVNQSMISRQIERGVMKGYPLLVVEDDDLRLQADMPQQSLFPTMYWNVDPAIQVFSTDNVLVASAKSKAVLATMIVEAHPGHSLMEKKEKITLLNKYKKRIKRAVDNGAPFQSDNSRSWRLESVTQEEYEQERVDSIPFAVGCHTLHVEN